MTAAIGNDANNCDRPTPCRTFQGAHNKTNSDGEITVLDPGGYGGLTITKSISIVNDGANCPEVPIPPASAPIRASHLLPKEVRDQLGGPGVTDNARARCQQINSALDGSATRAIQGHHCDR